MQITSMQERLLLYLKTDQILVSMTANKKTNRGSYYRNKLTMIVIKGFDFGKTDFSIHGKFVFMWVRSFVRV